MQTVTQTCTDTGRWRKIWSPPFCCPVPRTMWQPCNDARYRSGSSNTGSADRMSTTSYHLFWLTATISKIFVSQVPLQSCHPSVRASWGPRWPRWWYGSSECTICRPWHQVDPEYGSNSQQCASAEFFWSADLISCTYSSMNFFLSLSTSITLSASLQSCVRCRMTLWRCCRQTLSRTG